MASAVLERMREGMRETLIVKLGPDSPHAERWTFPFGPVEAGEAPEPAIRRILNDQLGIHAHIQHGQPPFDHAYGEDTYRWRFLFGDVDDDPILKPTYPESRWVPRQSMCEYEFEPVSQRVVDWLLEE